MTRPMCQHKHRLAQFVNLPLSMNSCAASRSASSFSGVSSGPAGSRNTAGISLSFYTSYCLEPINLVDHNA